MQVVQLANNKINKYLKANNYNKNKPSFGTNIIGMRNWEYFRKHTLQWQQT
jgi:hypothetical protein